MLLLLLALLVFGADGLPDMVRTGFRLYRATKSAVKDVGSDLEAALKLDDNPAPSGRRRQATKEELRSWKDAQIAKSRVPKSPPQPPLIQESSEDEPPEQPEPA